MLAFSKLNGPPTVKLLGNTPIGFGYALGAEGDCPSGTSYDVIADTCVASQPDQSAQDACNAGAGTAWNSMTNSCQVIATGQNVSSGGSSSGGGFWSDLVTSFTKGAAQGLVTPKPGMPMPIIVTPPWYTQWWGMAAIGIGVLGAGSLLLGKPKASSAVAGLFGIGKRRRRRR